MLVLADLPGSHGHVGPPCPITTGGECLLDLIRPEPAGADGPESYTPEQVRLLHLLAAWVRRLGTDQARAIGAALEGVLGEPGAAPRGRTGARRRSARRAAARGGQRR